MENVIEAAKILLADHLKNVPFDHGIEHAKAVLANAATAILWESNLEPDDIICILLASLLHDADDHKYFPENGGNARKIANISLSYWKSDLSKGVLLERIEKMIDLVAASKNKDKYLGEEWMLIPRNADRLEAMGWIGILRCYEYCKKLGTPLYTPETPRVTTEEELYQIATPERFLNYKGNSASMIDHFYDKLIHISTLETTNEWFLKEAKKRKQVLIDYLFDFGSKNFINENDLIFRNIT
jgi:uncharacterized protein